MNDRRANSNCSLHATVSVWLSAFALLSVVVIPPLFADPPPPLATATASQKPVTEDTVLPGPKNQQPPPTAAEIADWVKRLGARSFRDRESAMRKLAAAGLAAIPAVQDVGLDTKIEAALRAVGVLKEIYTTNEDGATIDAAEEALLKLKENANKSVGRTASEVLTQNYGIRQTRAVARIREFGGQVQFGIDPFATTPDTNRPANGYVEAVAIDGNWKGREDDYALISRLDSLNILYLIRGHKISEKRLTQLYQQLPDLKVQERGRSFLGVGTRLDILGCRIGEVKPASAAIEGGILTDDIVVEIGGKGVASPDDLIEIISDEEPGKKIKIVVLRTGDPFMRALLVEFRDDPDLFKPMLAIAILNEVRREVFVTLKPWNLNN